MINLYFCFSDFGTGDSGTGLNFGGSNSNSDLGGMAQAMMDEMEIDINMGLWKYCMDFEIGFKINKCQAPEDTPGKIPF